MITVKNRDFPRKNKCEWKVNKRWSSDDAHKDRKSDNSPTKI